MTNEELILKANAILETSDAARRKIEDLFKPPFRFEEITAVLTALVKAAEEWKPGPGQGNVKHELVRETWKLLDKKFGITDRIDDMIKLPVWAEWADGPVIRKIIDFLIVQAVTSMKSLGWGKA